MIVGEKKFPVKLRLGSRQFWWIYEARPEGGFQFSPTCHHKPPAVLRNLIRKGLMWAEKRQRFDWVGRTERWRGPLPGPEHWCGLTGKGRALLDERTRIALGGEDA